VHAYNPSYAGSRSRRIIVQGPSQAKGMKPYLKKISKQEGRGRRGDGNITEGMN
jgi:hypothetical protein